MVPLKKFSKTPTRSDASWEGDLYKKCLQMQLDEIDMLSAIFCSPGELLIYDPSVISDFTDYIDGKQKDLPANLHISVITAQNTEKIDIRIEFPHLYPILEAPVVAIITSFLSKARQNYAQNKITEYIDDMEKDENPYAYQIISWIQDQDFIQSFPDEIGSLDNSKTEKMVLFERLWIYSHHLKSKHKRLEIVRNARELNLTGFSRPGKPGVICVEGLKENTQDFWKKIRSMHWQKIGVRKSEEKSKKSSEEMDKCRRFENFREELFTSVQEGGEDEVRMDMSVFMKFLEQHKCGYIKKDLFGLN